MSQTIVIFRVFEAGHGDAAVAMHSGYRNYGSFAGYQNLRGLLEVRRQQDTLTASFDERVSLNNGNSSEHVGEGGRRATTISNGQTNQEHTNRYPINRYLIESKTL